MKKTLMGLVLAISAGSLCAVEVHLNPEKVESTAQYKKGKLTQLKSQLIRKNKTIATRTTCATCAPPPAEVYLGFYVKEPTKKGVLGSGTRVDLCDGSCTPAPEKESQNIPLTRPMGKFVTGVSFTPRTTATEYGVFRAIKKEGSTCGIKFDGKDFSPLTGGCVIQKMHARGPLTATQAGTQCKATSNCKATVATKTNNTAVYLLCEGPCE